MKPEFAYGIWHVSQLGIYFVSKELPSPVNYVAIGFITNDDNAE